MTATLATSDPVLTAFASEVGATGPVTVRGGRTRWTLGGEVDPAARELVAPAGIVQHRPDEMTVTVRAGTTVAELHAALAEHGQRTAMPDRGGTVGGAVVVGENDIRALGRGRLRDAILQVRYVSAEGRIVTSGGPTVKNVSGFDLPRLIVGSLGTLGLVAEVVVRTNPIPARELWLAGDGVDPGSILDATLAPGAVLTDGTRTWVQLEGHAADVDAQAAIVRGLGDVDEVDGPPDFPPHRWSLAPAAIGILADQGIGHIAAAGLGLAFADEPQSPRRLDPAVALIHERLKANFDPTGRLNPGRDPGRR